MWRLSKATITESHLSDIADAIRAKLGVATTYKPGQMAAAISSIPSGGGSVTVESLSVTENGTYTAPTGKAYSPVTVNVSGSGDIPLLTEAQWEALSTAQKQAYGLVAIQQANSGFNRGSLVNGADYAPFGVFNTGTGATSASMTIAAAGSYSLYAIALNSEASSYQLNLAASQNGSPLTDSFDIQHSYESSGTNRRNYRISKFDFTAAANDSISIALTNYSGYSAIVYAVVQSLWDTFDKAISTADTQASGSNTTGGMVIYGTFNGLQKAGTINVQEYMAGTTIATENPGSNYQSAYIFWFV